VFKVEGCRIQVLEGVLFTMYYLGLRAETFGFRV
jgi:hypothetical protein